jgi:Zn-finger nucleic acid-binding protein
MKCPRDGTELQPVLLLGIELDKCHKCDGLWCDYGELEKLEEFGETDLEEIIEEKYGDPEYREDQVDGYMRCPRCDGRLLEHVYTYVVPVNVDTCQSCYGVWLDDGELDKITGQKKGLDEATTSGKLMEFLSRIRGSLKK